MRRLPLSESIIGLLSCLTWSSLSRVAHRVTNTRYAALDEFMYQASCLQPTQCSNQSAVHQVSPCGLTCALESFVDASLKLVMHLHDRQKWNNTHLAELAQVRLLLSLWKKRQHTNKVSWKSTMCRLDLSPRRIYLRPHTPRISTPASRP
jgi:hypothetical protein